MSITHGSVGSSNLRGRQIFVNFRSCSAKFDQADAKTTGQKETEKYRIFLKLMHYFT